MKSIKSMKSIEIYEIHANLWNVFKSVKMHTHLSKSILIYGNLWQSTKIRENLWNVWNVQKSLKRYENNEIDQNLPKSKKSMAYPSEVLRIVYGVGFPLIRTLRRAFQTSGDGSRLGVSQGGVCRQSPDKYGVSRESEHDRRFKITIFMMYFVFDFALVQVRR